MVENNLTYGDLVYIRSLLDTSRQLGIFIVNQVFFVKHFSLKKASEFPVFSKGFSLL